MVNQAHFWTVFLNIAAVLGFISAIISIIAFFINQRKREEDQQKIEQLQATVNQLLEEISKLQKPETPPLAPSTEVKKIRKSGALAEISKFAAFASIMFFIIIGFSMSFVTVTSNQQFIQTVTHDNFVSADAEMGLLIIFNSNGQYSYHIGDEVSDSRFDSFWHWDNQQQRLCLQGHHKVLVGCFLVKASRNTSLVRLTRDSGEYFDIKRKSRKESHDAFEGVVHSVN